MSNILGVYFTGTECNARAMRHLLTKIMSHFIDSVKYNLLNCKNYYDLALSIARLYESAHEKWAERTVIDSCCFPAGVTVAIAAKYSQNTADAMN